MSTIKVTAPKPAVKQTSLGKLADSQEKIKLALAEIKTVIGDYGEDCCEKEEATQEDLNNLARNFYQSIDYIYSMLNEVYSRIYKSEDNMYEMMSRHLQGHAPAFKGASQLEKYVKMFMPGDVVVQPQVIYASDGKVSKLLLEIPIK